MAALNKAGQGSDPPSAQSSPRERGCGRGCADRGTPGCPSSHNGQTSLGQTTPDCSTPTGHRTGVTVDRNQGQSSHRTNARHEGTTNMSNPNSFQCFRCQGWGHMALGMSHSSHSFKPVWGTEGMQPNPPPATAATANSRPPAFPPQPQTKSDQYESSPKDGTAGSCPTPFTQSRPHHSFSGGL